MNGKQGERVGDTLGQSQRAGNTCQRLLWISEQPFGNSANVTRAGTGIVSAIGETVGRVSLRIVEASPGLGVRAGFRRLPAKPRRRPSAMVRLEPRSIVAHLFGHLQQSL